MTVGSPVAPAIRPVVIRHPSHPGRVRPRWARHSLPPPTAEMRVTKDDGFTPNMRHGKGLSTLRALRTAPESPFCHPANPMLCNIHAIRRHNIILRLGIREEQTGDRTNIPKPNGTQKTRNLFPTNGFDRCGASGSRRIATCFPGTWRRPLPSGATPAPRALPGRPGAGAGMLCTGRWPSPCREAARRRGWPGCTGCRGHRAGI